MDLARRMAGGVRDHLRGFQLMHWLARVFVSAIVRRVTYALVALVIAYLSISQAHAVDAGEAMQTCRNRPQFNASNSAKQCVDLGKQASTGQCRVGLLATNGGYLAFDLYSCDQTCEKRPDWNGPYPYLSGGKPRNGSVTCNGGCRQAWYSSGDGYFTGKYSSIPGTCQDYDEQKCQAQFGYSWNSAMSSCEPDEGKCPDGKATNSLGQCAPEPCPAGKVQQADGTCKNKENECPAGQIKSPDGKCLPGDGQCAQGEVRGKDGTCKKDSDGDGEPDEGEEGGEGPDGQKKDEFSGGDDCKTPPTCSGSPIMCGQARIQWRIDCNTRKNRNIAGGACNTQPVCTGDKCDALEYSGLLMQWRTACALEKLSSGTGNGGNADTAAIRNALTGTGGNPDYGTTSPGTGAWQGGGNTTPGTPNTAGYGWGSSCPQPPAFEVLGQSFQFDITPVCNWLGLGSYFVLGLAALISLRIVASREA